MSDRRHFSKIDMRHALNGPCPFAYDFSVGCANGEYSHDPNKQYLCECNIYKPAPQGIKNE